jgi:hypothetical protein
MAHAGGGGAAAVAIDHYLTSRRISTGGFEAQATTPHVEAAWAKIASASTVTKPSRVPVLLNRLLNQDMHLENIKKPTSDNLVECEQVLEATSSIPKPEVMHSGKEES